VSQPRRVARALSAGTPAWPNIRRMVHKSYLVFYRVGVTVEVLRIVHGARRYEGLFPDA